MQNTKKKKKRILESEKPKKGDVQVVKTGRQKKKKTHKQKLKDKLAYKKKEENMLIKHVGPSPAIYLVYFS